MIQTLKSSSNSNPIAGLPQARQAETQDVSKGQELPGLKDKKSLDKAAQDAGAFEAQLSQAGMQMPAVATPQLVKKSAVVNAHQPNVQAQVKAQVKAMVTTSAEQSPVTMKSAVGKSVGSVIAGLKPASKDWVFEGGDNENPNLKPLFGKSEAEKMAQAKPANPLIAQLAAQLVKKESELGEARGETDLGARNLAPQQNIDAAHADQSTSIQAPVTEHSPLLAQLGTQAGLMNGSVENLNTGNSKGLGANPKQSQLGQRLSGDEFLSTLKSVQNPSMAQSIAMAPAMERGSNNDSGDAGQSGDQAASQDKPNLRLIEGGAKDRHISQSSGSFENSIGAQNATLSSAPSTHLGASAMSAPATVMTGHVIQGAGAQDRLSSETLIGMSTGIRSMSANGGGEMRIRLRPENLGELHVRVMTDGSQVGLHIQATDEKAKKILEDSIGHLKESLLTQNLNLSQWDFTIAQPGKAEGGEMNNHSQWQNPSARQDLMQQNSGQNRPNQEGRSDRYDSGNDFGSRNTAPWLANSNRASPAAYSASGRLDVRA